MEKKLLLLFLFSALLLFNGCYTYLSLSSGVKLSESYYEPPYFPPTPPPTLGPPCCPEPSPSPIVIVISPPPQLDPYKRPREISDIRNGGDSRNLENNERRR